jgi:hypothetical protein
VGKPDGEDISEDKDVVGWTILECILERYDEVVWTGSIWLRRWTSGGLLLTQ